MEPQVMATDEMDVEQGNPENRVVDDEVKSCENQLEPSKIIDNSDIAERKNCFAQNETEIMDVAQETGREEHKRELDDDKEVEFKQKSQREAQSDNEPAKWDNQVAEEEEEEEEVEEKDTETDKVDEERITQANDNQEGSLTENNQSLGRNRRVRQKNRYLLDYHCIDLTKGGRGSNRDDYNAFTAATSARTSNRRSTTDSSRANNEESDVFTTKFCRRCSSRTPHDLDSGCQACLYKKIVESSKRKKVSSNRNRNSQTSTTQALPDSSQKQQSIENDVETNSSISTHSVSTSNSSNASTNGGSKRKATKQSGGQAKISPTNSAHVTTNCNTADGANYSDNDASISNYGASKDTIETQSNAKKHTNSRSSSENDNEDDECMKLGHIDTDDAENTNRTPATASPSPSPSPTNGVSSSNINSTKPNTNVAPKIIINTKNNTIITPAKNACVPAKCPRVDSWTPDEVADYIISKGFRDEAELFKTQSVDGISLLLMQRTDFTYGLKIKLGPALKIYDQVCKLKKEYFKGTPTSN